MCGRRRERGTYNKFVQERILDGEKFEEYFDLTKEQFAGVLHLVGESLVKKQL